MKTAKVPKGQVVAYEQRVCRAVEAKFPQTRYPREWDAQCGSRTVHCRVDRHVAATDIEGDENNVELAVTGALEAASADDVAMAKLTKPDRDSVRAMVAGAALKESETPDAKAVST